jgi:hypothetical protein
MLGVNLPIFSNQNNQIEKIIFQTLLQNAVLQIHNKHKIPPHKVKFFERKLSTILKLAKVLTQ